jgi:hypothetical protein
MIEAAAQMWSGHSCPLPLIRAKKKSRGHPRLLY